MLVLRGLLENVLGNYACLRGYATLGDLAKISQTDPSFQRDINIQHKEDIIDFYEKGQNVFFSEVILALNLNDEYVNFEHDFNAPEILVKSNTTEKTVIELSTNQTKEVDQKSDNPKIIRNVAIRFDTDFAITNKPLIRIDGNHRLQAAEDTNQTTLEKMCPFCIILFQYDDIEHYDDESISFDKVRQSIIFHNINSKGMALTSEETLKGIFEASGYEDDALNMDMGWEYVVARKIHSALLFNHIQHIKPIFEDRERSVLVDMIKFLDEERLIEDNSLDTNLFNNCIASTNQIYANNEQLKENKVIFIAVFYFIYKQFKESPNANNIDNLKIAEAFVNWLISNHMCSVVLEHPMELVEIYNRLHGNDIKIFMAMPYYDEDTVKDYNDALDTVVSEITNKNPHVNLSNYPIMTNHSPTHNIVSDIFEKIEKCQIFIADITNNNANVLYEYGYAKGRDKPCILLQNKKEKSEQVKSDYGLDLRFEFNGHSSLKQNLQTEIESVLTSLGYALNS